MSNRKNGTVLVIIDPEDDFMDKPGAALPVPGALADMARLAYFIQKNGAMIDDIRVPLDTHVEDHIANAIRWVDKNGNHPASYTVITESMVNRGVWRAANPADQMWQSAYVRLLKQTGGKDLMIWPTHCVKGTDGHRIEPTLMKALDSWAKLILSTPHILEKGMNRDTEQYGAFAADVVIESDPSTNYNQRFVDDIRSYDRQVWAGEALSHCVMASFDQAYSRIPLRKNEHRIILTDATSPVSGFEQMSNEWLALKQSEGVRLTTTTELIL